MPANSTRLRRKWLFWVGLLALASATAAVAFARAPMECLTALRTARLAIAGVHSRTLTLEGLQTHYLEGGQGEPVVLVHGLGARALDWAPLLPGLVRAGYHVYALDLPGFGSTAAPPDRTYSVREQAKFLESFLRTLGLDHVALVGLSMGGWIAATLALEEPERVVKLVLMDSAGFAFKLGFDPALLAPSTPEQVDGLLALLMPHPRAVPGFVKADVIRYFNTRRWVIERALLSMDAGADNLDQRFASLKMPLLLVWGQEDKVTPLALGVAMHRAAPQSVLQVYEGCGHVAPLWCARRVAPNLLSFLAGRGPAAGSTVVFPEE